MFYILKKRNNNINVKKNKLITFYIKIKILNLKIYIYLNFFKRKKTFLKKLTNFLNFLIIKSKKNK